jgi:hypothetical protein
VEFEDGLSISFLKNMATRYKNLDVEIVKFLKKSNVFKRRRRAFLTLVCPRSKLGVPMHARASKVTGAYSTEYSHEDGSK